jgi:hypothetical protein
MAPWRDVLSRNPIAVDVISNALLVTEPMTVVLGAHPPAADERPGGTAVAPVVDLTAECCVPICAQALRAV